MEQFEIDSNILKQLLERNLDSKLTRELAIGIFTTFCEFAKPKVTNGDANPAT